MDINTGFLQWFIFFFDKKSSVANTSGGDFTRALSLALAMRDKCAIKSKIMPNQQLAEELQIENSKNVKYTHLLNTILEYMQLMWICN